VLIAAVLLFPILLGMSALAVDLGSYASERRSLQNAADAIALAAGRDLPDATKAQAAAQTWATNNGIDPNSMTVTVFGGSTTPTVRVVLSKPHGFTFMRFLGVSSASVGAKAAAEKFSTGANTGVVPWSVTQAALNSASPGSQVTLKYDANNVQNGNFGPIGIDGSGASTYQQDLSYGSQTVACAVNTPNCSSTSCPGTFPTTCAEDAPSCDGPDCNPETGNMVGPTRSAVDFRMTNTSAACSSFNQVFTPISAVANFGDSSQPLADAGSFSSGGRLLSPPENPAFDKPPTHTPVPTNTPAPPTATPTAAGGPTPVPTSTPGGQMYALNPNCNPWAAGGACPPSGSTPCSRRVIMVPIINAFGNGSSTPVTIQGFALFYLEGYGADGCSGNSCDVQGEFVNAELTTGALAGAYDPSASVQFVKLVE